MAWHLRHGAWWCLQWVAPWDGWLSLGLHLDLRARRNNRGERYGPYVDLHLGWAVLSLGVRPAFSCDLEQVVSVSRGGLGGG